MVKAYTVNLAGGQISPEPVIITPCGTPRDGQPENNSAEDTAPYVLEAARRYFEYYLSSVRRDPFYLQELEDVSKVAESDTIVCAFDTPAEASLKWINSVGTHVAGADLPEGNTTELSSLLMSILEADIWTYLANNRNLFANPEKTKLFSGKTCVLLSQFKHALQTLVDDDVIQQVCDIETLERTIFWRRMMNPEVPAIPTESNFMCVSASSNTFPRIRKSTLSASRPRVTSDSWVPRSMPGGKPEYTDRYNRDA